MAERVVDVLEAVEIEIEERQPRALAPRLDQRPVEAVVEERAVGEAGQRIVEGEVLRLRLARLAARCEARRSRRASSATMPPTRSSATPSAGAVRVRMRQPGRSGCQTK